MGLRLSHTTFDASNPYEIAEFWRVLLDWHITENDSYRPGSDGCYLVDPDGSTTVLFMTCPDPKTVKNRVHLDIVPTRNSTQKDELARAISLGATVAADLRDDHGWVVMADPEGNEFCILSARDV